MKLRKLITTGKIILGGNRKLKIYGELNCKSGKKMKVENRVFFESEKEAIENGYRPCGHCSQEKYKRWKGEKDITT
jgi:methylphosphotriester-DNA--protein-cysteine methyltransferase